MLDAGDGRPGTRGSWTTSVSIAEKGSQPLVEMARGGKPEQYPSLKWTETTAHDLDDSSLENYGRSYRRVHPIPPFTPLEQVKRPSTAHGSHAEATPAKLDPQGRSVPDASPPQVPPEIERRLSILEDLVRRQSLRNLMPDMESSKSLMSSDRTAEPQEREDKDEDGRETPNQRRARLKDRKYAAPNFSQSMIEMHRITSKGVEKAVEMKVRRNDIDSQRRFYSLLAACSGIFGTLLAIIQNELIYRLHPKSGKIDILKALNSFSTFLCAVWIFYMYRMQLRLVAMNQRLRVKSSKSAKIKEIGFLQVLASRGLWLELLICVPHLPPTFSPEYGMEVQSKNFIVYRGETIFCVYNILRIYLLWRCIRDFIIKAMPKHFTIEAFTQIDIGSFYVLKSLLEGWKGFQFVAFAWIFSMLVLGYFFRAFETSACLFPYHDHPSCFLPEAVLWKIDSGSLEKESILVRYSDALWAMFITSTSV